MDSARVHASRACRQSWACDRDSGQDKRTVRKDTQSYVSVLEARVATLQARLDALESARPDDQDSQPVPVGRLEFDGNGELRWHNETNAFSSVPIDPFAVPPPPLCLPVPLADEVHAELVNAAFTWHFSAFRLVEQQSFIEGLLDGRRSSIYSPFLHLAVLAIGSRYLASAPPELCSPPHDTASRGEIFANAALELLSTEIAAPTFSTIRGLMSLAIYFAGVAKPHQGWIYAGLAYRICDDFGLHLDASLPDGVNDELRMQRRRLFWTCFTDDVNWSLCIGRPCKFDLDSVHQPELELADPSSPAGSGAAWAYETRLQPIAWHISRLGYAHLGDSAQQERRALVEDLWEKLRACVVPPSLRAAGAASITPDVFELEVLYHLLVILLFKPFYISPASQELHALARAQCDSSSASVADLVKQYQAGPGLRFASNNVYHAIFHGGAMAAQVASRADNWSTRARALDDVNVCVGALIEHAETWPSAALVASALAGVRDAVPARCSPFGTAAEPGPALEPLGALGPLGPSGLGRTALSGMGIYAAALSPWDDVDFARQFGLDEYLGVDWNVGRCVVDALLPRHPHASR
ncbi:hypothetical protein JCM9279_005172 [Rhodotorula babjevae]